ncbi:MAG TPA: hypothetical protein GYA08_08130 [Chloroflexi bacterium]|nr:hypothetical protein [Chloroflexota bacterium]
MKHWYTFLLITVILGLAGFAWGAPASADETPRLLEFKTMAGVSRPYTGGANAIRGVSGGGLPWVLKSAKGELRADGTLEVKVKGLVFDPNDPVVIERGLAGQNTVPEFRAIVSCQSVDGNGNATVVNLATAPFPATTGLGAGDAEIETRLSLPSPCIAPIIFVTNPAGAWFAATGR